MKLTVDPKHPIGRGKLLWLVTGRIPGDDDDTPHLILANTENKAQSVFRAYMLDLSNIDKVSTKQLTADHGTPCFIITCNQIGQVEPDLAPLLHEAADRMQKLNNDAEDWARSCEDPKAERAACRVTDKLITKLHHAASAGEHP